MGQPCDDQPVMLVLSALSRHVAAREWALAQASAAWQAPALASAVFDFCETDYYAPSMGAGLKLQIWGFDRPTRADELAAIKQQTNVWEAAYAKLRSWPESRPLNLDPGYVTLGKFVLATTKDHAHRVYLRDGIFAEVTLAFSQGAWRAWPWTYPNYRRADYQQFLSACRDRFRARRREGSGP